MGSLEWCWCITVPYSSLGTASRVRLFPSAQLFHLQTRPFPSASKPSVIMATHKYQILGGDSEKGESTYPVSSGHSSSSTIRASTSLGTISIVLGALGAFLLGMISTMAMVAVKSQYYGMGHYETGFREEKLCKAANSSRESSLTPECQTDLISRRSTCGVDTAGTSSLQISSRFRGKWA